MIGKNQIVLNRDAVIEALQEYISKRIVNGEQQIVREYSEWCMASSAPVYQQNGAVLPQEPPGLIVTFEHAKHFVTGKA